MELPEIRQIGVLLARYKRFLADVLLEDQRTITVHCPNSGSMRGCSQPGSPVVISYADNKKRKFPWTLEMVQQAGVWIGVNTGRTNALVREALCNGVITDFGTIKHVRQEVVVSSASRLDFLIDASLGTFYLEVKNCSMGQGGVAAFPDAITGRGTKHLHELVRLVEQGENAAVLFCVQRDDVHTFQPAGEIDPVYAETAAWACRQGVRFFAYKATITPDRITITEKIPVIRELTSEVV